MSAQAGKRQRKKPLSKLAKDSVETAEGMHRLGILDRPTYEKITRRHLGPNKQWRYCPPPKLCT